MTNYLVISLVSGILMGVLDGFINGNSFAARLYQVYKPIFRDTVNIPVGFAIDIFFGFLLAGVFLVIYPGLPGASGLLKGLSYGVLVWLFRGVMGVLSQWVMYKVPPKTLVYTLLTGLVEMLVLGLLYGAGLNSAVSVF